MGVTFTYARMVDVDRQPVLHPIPDDPAHALWSDGLVRVLATPGRMERPITEGKS